MPPEILALIDKPLSLIAVLFVGALFGMTVEQVVSKQRREAWKRASRRRFAAPQHERFSRAARPEERLSGLQGRSKARLEGVPDAAEQLRIVMASDFHAQPLLNRSEKRLFEALDQLVIDPSTSSGQDLLRRGGRSWRR